MNKPPNRPNIDISWDVLESTGCFPATRYGGDGIFYQDHIWLVCGAGAGIGKTSQLWKYSIIDKKWMMIDAKGDIPSSRDGHSINYIGEKLFIMFGGQGRSIANDKFSRQADKSRSLSLGIREVFNDIYRYDIPSSTWSHIIAEGTFFPAGRRGHSCVYVGNIHPTSSGNVNYNTNPLVKNQSLIMFGGAGFEIGKFSEQVYNDTWIYSIATNRWERVFPAGETPRACYNHRAELVGEYMVVVGGILSPATAYSSGRSTPGLGSVDNSSPCNIMLLNIITLTWSHIRINSSIGQTVRLNIHGHSMVRSSRSNPHKLLIFGGKEATDLKRAEEFSQCDSSYYTSSSMIWELDVRRAMLSAVPIMTMAEDCPENRCGHLAVSGIPADELITSYEKLFRKSEPGLMETPLISPGPPVMLPVAPVSLSVSSPRGMKSPHADLFLPPAPEEGKALVYIFGGSRISVARGGYCDPVIYQLTATPRVQTIRSPINKHRNPLIGLNAAWNKRNKHPVHHHIHHQASESSSLSLQKSPSSQIISSHHHRISSESSQHDHDADNDSLSQHQDDMHGGGGASVNVSGSLWESKISQSGMLFRNPKNWHELKLALMQPISTRVLISSRNIIQPSTLTTPDPVDHHMIVKPSHQNQHHMKAASSTSYDMDTKSIFSKNDMEEFYRTGLLLEHSQELSMIPSDYNARDFMKLSSHDKDRVLATSIASSLGLQLRGKTYHAAKKEYYRHYPPPSYAKERMSSSMVAGIGTSSSSSFFTATGSHILNSQYE